MATTFRTPRTAPSKQPVKQIHEAYTYPAPTGGLNYTDPLVSQNPNDAVVLTNLITRAFGNEIRKGYRRHTAPVPAGGRTLMPYQPPTVINVPSKFFLGAANGSIYDITSYSPLAAPSLSVNIPSQTNPGRFSWTNYATPASNYLCICGNGGGYWTYETIEGWVQRTQGGGPGQVSGVNPGTFDFVMSWKNRLMFIQNGTPSVWYLGPNAIGGAATEFDFGPLLVHGGSLAAMASWTIDDGSGLDDKLVLVGTQGDVLVYEGFNVADTATFRLVGRWYIGRVPIGRRFMDRYGGDLMLLSERGLISMNSLTQNLGKEQDQHDYGKVNRALSRLIAQTLTNEFWEFRFYFGEQLMIINYPEASITDKQFLTQEINSKAWSLQYGVPSGTIEVYEGVLYGTDASGAVYQLFYGDTDGAVDVTPGKEIEGEIQTAFQTHGEAVRLKRFIQVYTQFIGPSAPSVMVQINTDWSFQQIPGSPSYVNKSGATWNNSKWDKALWSGGLNHFAAWSGVQGLGYYGSLRLRIRGAPGTVFASWTSLVEPGGIQ